MSYGHDTSLIALFDTLNDLKSINKNHSFNIEMDVILSKLYKLAKNIHNLW